MTNKRSLLAAAIKVFVIFILAAFFYININVNLASREKLQDFGSFIASGQLVVQGENPYNISSPLIFSVNFDKIGISGIAPNLNPPISVLIFRQLANIPPNISVQAWRILSIALYFFIVFNLIRANSHEFPSINWKVIWALSLAGFWHTVELGQLYILLLALASGTVIYAQKNRPIVAGVFLGGLIAIKPNFIFWALALWAAGYGSIFLTAGITALSISLLPFFTYGYKIYEQWLKASQIFTPHLLAFPGNNSLQGLTARFSSPQTGVALSMLLAIGVLIFIRKNRSVTHNTHLLGIITSLLISPIAWTGYTILLLPTLMKENRWNLSHWISAGIFTLPFFMVLGLFEENYFNFVFFGWFYGWGLLILLISELTTYSYGFNQAFTSPLTQKKNNDQYPHPDELINFQEKTISNIGKNAIKQDSKQKNILP